MFGDLKKTQVIDHVNHNLMDARRENLRLTNQSGNMQNRKPKPYRGTTFHRRTGKWQATAFAFGRHNYIGLFESRDDAAAAASEKRKELNFLTNTIT